MSVIKWMIAWVSYSSGQMDKPTEKWLHRSIVFHGLFYLFGVREVQIYSRSFSCGSNIYFRWTGGSFLKRANGFQTMTLLQWSLKHNDTGPSHPFFFLSPFWQFLKFQHQCCLRSVEELFLGCVLPQLNGLIFKCRSLVEDETRTQEAVFSSDIATLWESQPSHQAS